MTSRSCDGIICFMFLLHRASCCSGGERVDSASRKGVDKVVKGAGSSKARLADLLELIERCRLIGPLRQIPGNGRRCDVFQTSRTTVVTAIVPVASVPRYQRTCRGRSGHRPRTRSLFRSFVHPGLVSETTIQSKLNAGNTIWRPKHQGI
ncbi:hypothetical protein B0H15DRAFT_175651 [Mycena belliarum]|uniref:Secreted protein n=1 Tax=Mycena belliarum TaxID=1033014 RepID=A0AAD6UC37_9AGAR|nr:hypothetical protein B0H15DRAFT_175651 [Mycena belliae]